MTAGTLAILLLCAIFGAAVGTIYAACILSGRISQAEESLSFPDEDGDWLGG